MSDLRASTARRTTALTIVLPTVLLSMYVGSYLLLGERSRWGPSHRIAFTATWQAHFFGPLGKLESVVTGRHIDFLPAGDARFDQVYPPGGGWIEVYLPQVSESVVIGQLVRVLLGGEQPYYSSDDFETPRMPPDFKLSRYLSQQSRIKDEVPPR